MSPAVKGRSVTIHYVGKLSDGTQFVSTEAGEPLTFDLGSGAIHPAIDEALAGMAPGDRTTVQIPMDQAFGPYREDLVMRIDRAQLPPDFPQIVGGQVEMTVKEGQSVLLTVTDVTEDKVMLDANHPLAGKDLTYEVELIAIE